MTRIAILGAGAGGSAAAVELIGKGYEVSLWSRSERTVATYRKAGSVAYVGVLGEGEVSPRPMTSDLESALEGADGVLVVLPAVAHEDVARALATLGCSVPIVLNPGGTGGALLFRRVFLDSDASLPPIAELSTLTYIARKTEPGRVSVYKTASSVHAACLPGGRAALDLARSLFGGVRVQPNVMSTSLRNINLVLHPPAALLSVAWVEATRGDFLFYAEAMTAGVFRATEAFDAERMALGEALGLELPSFADEMMEVGSVDADYFDRGLIRESIARGRANATIKAPDSLEHRYYREDLPCAVLPFAEIAARCDVATPVADAILTLGSVVIGDDVRSRGFTASRLGIQGLDRSGLLRLVSGRTNG